MTLSNPPALLTRGEKLNNPLNIRISSNHWQGKLSPSRDIAFETFDIPSNGIRAGAKILLNYQREGLQTIHEFICRWAPSSENPTAAYCDNVADFTGIKIDAITNLFILNTLASIITAMIYQESGRNIYDRPTIEAACQSALATA